MTNEELKEAISYEKGYKDAFDKLYQPLHALMAKEENYTGHTSKCCPHLTRGEKRGMLKLLGILLLAFSAFTLGEITAGVTACRSVGYSTTHIIHPFSIVCEGTQFTLPL